MTHDARTSTSPEPPGKTTSAPGPGRSDALPAGARRDRVEVGSATVEVVSAGDGPPLLLLHGWPETWWRWREVIAPLARGRHVVALDLPGLGGSASHSGDYSTRALAGVLLEVASRMSIDAFALAGHDWGGSVAYAMAATARERVTHLVVEEELLPGFRVEPDGLALGTYPTWHGEFHRLRDLPERLVRGREDDYYGYFWDLTARPGVIDDVTRRVYLESYRSERALEAGLGLYRAAAEDAEHHRALARSPLTLPLLAIGGSDAIGRGVARSLRHVARTVEDHVVARCGHYPAEEHPAGWVRVVESFLSTG